MSACKRNDCNWPKCVGPIGCMRIGLPGKKIAAEPVKTVVAKKPRKPQDKSKKKKSVSISGPLYLKVQMKAKFENRSVSGVVEEEIARFFKEKGDTQ